jgi:hypothetical protein
MVYLGSEVRRTRFIIEAQVEMAIRGNDSHILRCKAIEILYDELKECELRLIKFFHNWEEAVEPDMVTSLTDDIIPYQGEMLEG